MIFHDRLLSLSDIDRNDDRYQITAERENADLIRSVQALGLLSPPILIANKHDAYTIVAGFRRIDVCLALGMTEIPVRMLDAAADALTCAETAVADNVFQRPLNLIEQSRALALLNRFCPEKAALAEKAEALQLPSNFDMVDKLLRLDVLPSKLKNGVQEAVLPLSIALDLAEMPPDEGSLTADLFLMLKPGLNKQREIITLIKEIALREDISVKEVLTLPEVLKILENEKTDRNVKTGSLRKYLRKRRYPSITKTETDFRQFVKTLDLGNNARLIPPRDFEGTAYSLILTFSDSATLNAHRKTVRRILDHLPKQSFLST